MGEHERIVGRERLEFVFGADERELGHRGDLCGERLGKQAVGIEPGADRGTALCQCIQAGQGEFDTLDAMIDLRRIAAEFLP